MKSFRLDQNSVTKFLRNWLVVAAALAVFVLLIYLGWWHAAWRVALVLFAGSYFGYLCRGGILTGIRRRFPNAVGTGILAIGFGVMTCGVLARMTFPETQGSAPDVAWLSVSFTCILTFVIINRRDPDVWR